jgi:hypothetical protein
MKDVSLAYSLALPTNIRQGWKEQPKTNALAYYEKLSFTAVKSLFYVAT